MSIIQISKIQQRSGNLVDLPQLDEAEFGWATDAKKLFIGKITPNENIEVLTSYSQIDLSQVNGAVGNLNISALSVADGQILTYDGNNWVNRGGDAGGLITLGNVSNVKITGGAIGYVLETDGTGNLSWTPKSTIIAYIENVTQANPAVVTTVQDNFFTDGLNITITDAPGMTELNGNTYYVDVLTANTFALYSDSALTTTVDSTGYNEYAYTSVSATTISTNVIDVGNAALLAVDAPVRFLGDMTTSGIENDFTYYVKTRDTLANTITISNELLPNGVAGNTVPLQTTAGLTANVYQEGGRAISSVSSGGSTGVAGGANTSVQFNNSNLLDGDADLTYDFGASPKLLTLNGNANVGNLNGTGVVTATRFISNIATGTAPLQVTSTTRVANLNVAYANVSDFEAVTAQTTGTFYPVFVNGSTTANYALGSNSSLSFNALTGNLSTTRLNVTSNANIGGNLGVVGNISGANLSVSNITSLGSISVTGNANVGNIGTTNGLFTSNITVNNITANNAANIGTTLDVGGIATFAANANVTGNINVTGNVNVATRLNVTSVATFSANANVTGNVNVTANLLAGNVLSNGTVGGNTATLFGTTLTSGANVNAGTIIGNWTLSSGSKLQATYADLAEYYKADNAYDSGTVVQFGGDAEITIADNETPKVAGVVSANPAIVMNAKCVGSHPTAMALQGRVHCKVIGAVSKGDMMVSAGEGYAKACSTPTLGTVIGKSLENFTGTTGIIEIVVGRL